MYNQITFKERLMRYYRKHPVSFVLIALNTFTLIITFFYNLNYETNLLTMLLSFNGNTLYDLGGMYPIDLTENHQYYRLFTAMFLHGSFLHYLMNMYFLSIIGRTSESLLGKKKYILIYLLSGLGSSLLVWGMSFVYPATSDIVTIGASGALFGLLGTLLLLTYKKPMLFSPQGIRSIRSLVLINIFFTFIISDISVFGHIGGLVTGVLLAYILFRDNNSIRPQTQQQRHNSHYGNYVIDADDVTDDDIYYTN